MKKKPNGKMALFWAFITKPTKVLKVGIRFRDLAEGQTGLGLESADKTQFMNQITSKYKPIQGPVHPLLGSNQTNHRDRAPVWPVMKTFSPTRFSTGQTNKLIDTIT